MGSGKSVSEFWLHSFLRPLTLDNFPHLSEHNDTSTRADWRSKRTNSYNGEGVVSSTQLLMPMKVPVPYPIPTIPSRKDTAGTQVGLEHVKSQKDIENLIGKLMKLCEQQNKTRQSLPLECPVYHGTDLRLHCSSPQGMRGLSHEVPMSHPGRIPQSGPHGQHSGKTGVSRAQVKDELSLHSLERHICV